MAVTIHDVAKLAGVNSSTVSRVINGKATITPDTKERVYAAMRELENRGERFDAVIVDPPSFAKASNEREQALNSYSRLAVRAVRLLKRRGLLVFASCSSRVQADELFAAVHSAASNEGFPLQEIERRAEAPDHPADFKESHYLKCMYARLKDR